MSLQIMPVINLPRCVVNNDASCACCGRSPQNDGGKEWIAHQDMMTRGQTYTFVDPTHKDCAIENSTIGQTANGARAVFYQCMRCYNANQQGEGVMLDLNSVISPEEKLRPRSISHEEKRPRPAQITPRIRREIGHILMNHANKVGVVAGTIVTTLAINLLDVVHPVTMYDGAAGLAAGGIAGWFCTRYVRNFGNQLTG